jgi:glucoamylase
MDVAAIRDLGLLVTASGGFVSEEKRHAEHRSTGPVPGVPHYRLVNTCARGRYRIEKEVIADPARPVVLQRIRFQPLQGRLEDYHLFALLAPHLGNQGAGNTARVGDYKGVPTLIAERDGDALCLMTSRGFRARSVGFVGVSDGWQDLMQHGELRWGYTLAENGNVALVGELAMEDGEAVLALAFGRNVEEAAHQARASLGEGFDPLRDAYVQAWERWQGALRKVRRRPLFASSAMVVKVHQSKRVRGAILASLSVPWGFAKGDGDIGGYHLVWPRDMVEAAGGLLAAGAHAEAREALGYLAATQSEDGHWPQNMWAEGIPYWSGVQMDETALPILLVDLARREGALGKGDRADGFWPMVRRAASFIARNGPATPQDRWEEDAGYTPFTLAAEIAALLAAADLAEEAGEPGAASYLRETADCWNSQVERWLYVADTELSRGLGIHGYYVRVTPPDRAAGRGWVPIRNRPPGEARMPAESVLCTDALALVRFGLRAADDPRIVDTVRAIDASLRAETPAGPCWHRYTGDGYGEHPDGSPFDGTGVGRLWPLLTGERAHYALALGDERQARQLLRTLEGLAGEGGLLPEQTWDAPDIPERELLFGRPAGSAMPLVWAHAEHLKLLRSLADRRVFDTPPQTVRRYQRQRMESHLEQWRFDHRIRELPRGKTLRVEVLESAVVRWSPDGWRGASDVATRDSGLGVHYADLPTESLGPGAEVRFTFRWPAAGRWEDADYEVTVREQTQGDRRPAALPKGASSGARPHETRARCDVPAAGELRLPTSRQKEMKR